MLRLSIIRGAKQMSTMSMTPVEDAMRIKASRECYLETWDVR